MQKNITNNYNKTDYHTIYEINKEAVMIVGKSVIVDTIKEC